MKRMMILLVLLAVLVTPARAMDFEAPEAPEQVIDVVPQEADSFGEGLWNVVKASFDIFAPSLAEALRVSLQVMASVLLCSLIRELFPGSPVRAVDLACTAAVAAALLAPASSLIQLGVDTVTEISEYGKLLLPVMTGALAAQGGVTSSTALYAGTALFDAVLSALINRLVVPVLYLYLGICIANAAFPERILEKLQQLIHWAMTWMLKIALYIFTGYLSITGVVSGTTDASTMKAAKATISAAVPVVGNILSDASEAVLVGAGVLRSTAGVYGLLTVAALFLSPFLQIGIQYLLLKGTAALCEGFDGRKAAGLIGEFASAMGMVLATVGTQSVLLLVSTVCFMRGVS